MQNVGGEIFHKKERLLGGEWIMIRERWGGGLLVLFCCLGCLFPVKKMRSCAEKKSPLSDAVSY